VGGNLVSASKYPSSFADSVSPLARGKELVLARCARCHGENGDKPLRTGVPLSERGLASEVITRAVKGRLADSTGDEQPGVPLYIVKYC
jgi:mono/diheme cytochrome c family protein